MASTSTTEHNDITQGHAAMSKYKATMPTEPQSNGHNYAREKEKHASYTVIAYKNGEFHEPVELCCYSGRSRNASVHYATIWLHGDKINSSGSGSAGGSGYHKDSAAADEAIRSAGIKLHHCSGDRKGERAYISGVGERAIREALGAIARAMGFRKFTIVEN
jgi:hypothetical protein